MKQIFIFSRTFILAFFLFSCEKPCTCNGDYTVDKHPNICIKFKGNIGNDFDSALDSLKKWYEPKFNTLATEGHYSGEGYYIEQKQINVDFAEDDRVFFLLTFIDSVSVNLNYIATNDVIDEKGNYYQYIEGRLD
jgi:hypothetical protein